MLGMRVLLLSFLVPNLAAISITVASSVSGRSFAVSGTDCGAGTYTTPQILNWTAGASCTVTFDSPQGVQGGVRYAFNGWLDSPAGNPRTILTPPQAATFTANFLTQYLVSTAVQPPGSGTVTGADWYSQGTLASFTAVPAAGFRFVGWSSQFPPAGTTLVIPVGAPLTIVANFAPLGTAPPGNYGVTRVAANSGGRQINNFGQVTGSSSSSAFLWTPVAANSPVGDIVEIAGAVSFGSATGAGINARGQVAGTRTSAAANAALPQVFLWTPDTPNGSTGTIKSIIPGDTSNALGINSYGQVAGNGPTGAFIWTPASANGTTGAINSDSRLNGLIAINDFGQAIVNSGPQATLFTPATANGATGTFSAITGLPGAVSSQLLAINKNGVIAGVSCVSAQGSCAPRAFLWTPTAPNGTTGSAVEIPAPAGYSLLTPQSINSGGQVVGSMQLTGGSTVPFLYSAGAVYDLGVIDSQIAIGSAVSINDAGQIVLLAPGGTYLLTPGTAPVQANGTVGVTIASTPPGQSFLVTGSGCSAGAYNTPQIIYWTPAATCNVVFLSPHSSQVGTRYIFNAWQDGPTSNPRAFAAPAQAVTYSASFTQQFLISTAANPADAGTVSGGGWFSAGAPTTLTATAAAGFRLLDWTPGNIATPGSNTANLTVNGPLSVVANFISLAAVPPSTYLTNQIALGSTAGMAKPLNNFGQVVGSSASGGAFIWTPIAAGSAAGDLAEITGLSIGAATSAAMGINDFGQVIGTTTVQTAPYSQPFLWTPATPNGTTGTAVNFLGGSSTFPQLTGISNYGQIAGNQNGSPFIWTPASPNGNSGTVNTDGRLGGVVGINDFGQAITGAAATLFTPSSPHGSTGTFTPIPGLPGGGSTQLIAINNGGVVVGTSCNTPLPGVSCQPRAFLWTPATPNAITGTTAEIPPPAGYVVLIPTALNDTGQVVGSMLRADGTITPFLYVGGSVYDLTAVSSQLRGMIATGINNRGQIVVNGLGTLYLLTPVTPPSQTGTVPVTIGANAPIAPFTVAGNGCNAGAYVAPQTLLWLPGSSCTVTFLSPHSPSLGARFLFGGWTDSTSGNPRTITAPSAPATYTATFSIQFFVSTVANPAAGGLVAGGGWYSTGTVVTLTAAANPDYRFIDWIPSSLGTSPTATLTVLGPQTATANFVALSSIPPGNYQIRKVTALPGSSSPPGHPLNNFGQVTGNAGTGGFLWTPATANGLTGTLTSVSGLVSVGPNDIFSSINDVGQIVGTTIPFNSGLARHFLWSPSSPNGTTGTAVNFLANASGDAITGLLDINSFGQISGNLIASPFLWTPNSPNGTTGVSITDNRLANVRAINDYGQAIANSQPVAPTLFTPSAPHENSGTFVPVFGLPGAQSTQLADITNAGAIVGWSCIAAVAPPCYNHAFVWTPAAANGTTGSASEIALPDGVVSMTPTALNASGQIVGTMTTSFGPPAPFLYSNGKVYDLGTLSGELRGGLAAGINDHGQIVVNASGAVYLLTPQNAHVPVPVSVTPGAGGGGSQTMTFEFADSAGAEDLDVVNILINNFLDGRDACYLAYSRPTNVLYLVNDAGTALLSGVVLNGPGTTSNNQCSVTVSGPAIITGSSLKLTLAVTFSAAFGGNKVVYLAARDLAQNNSGWRALGTWGVSGATPGPATAVSVAPARGSGSSQSFTFTFNDTKGVQDLGVVNILINDFLDGRNACYLAYSRALNVLYLVNDPGTALLPNLSNSQCSITQFAANAAGNTLTLSMNLSFSPSFSGNRVVYLAARDNGDVNTSGWQALGSWTVP